MKNRYKAVVNITNTTKYNSAIFGCYFDYYYKHSKYFRILNKLFTIKTYKLKITPVYISSSFRIEYSKYIKELNVRRLKTKALLKENSTLSISLFKYLFVINITNYKDYNICRINKKLNKIVLE